MASSRSVCPFVLGVAVAQKSSDQTGGMHEVTSRSHHSRFAIEASSEAAEDSSDGVANRSHRDRGDGLGVPRQVSFDKGIGATNMKSPLQQPAGIHAFGRDPFVGDGLVGPDDAVTRLGDPSEEAVAGSPWRRGGGQNVDGPGRRPIVSGAITLWVKAKGRSVPVGNRCKSKPPQRGTQGGVLSGYWGICTVTTSALVLPLHLEQSVVEPMGISWFDRHR